jgi:type I restriction enzyme S subunit
MRWGPATLDSLCLHTFSGGTPPTNNDAYYGGDIPWLRTQEVTFGRIFDTEIKITETGLKNSSAKWVPEKSVIVAMYGNSAGRSAINEIPLTTNQACCNLIIDPDKADYRYVFYALLRSYETLKGLSRGAAQNNLNAAQVKAFTIPAPPVQVQQDIGDILSSYDDLIENNRRRMALLEESARLLYREWFVRLRFPGHEHTRIVDGLPEGWERKTLGDSITLNYGKALKAEIRVEGDYPVYGSSGIVGTHEKPLVKCPAIILGRKGNVGSVYWSSKSFYPIDTVYFVTPESSSLYLFYALKNMHFISTDVAVPGLNRDFAYSRPLLHPPVTLLRSFHETVDPMHAQLDKLDETNQKLRAARDLLLPRLMSGELAT